MECAVIAVDIPEERADTAAEVTVYFHDEGIEEHCRVSDLFSEGEKARAFLDKLIQKYALAERTLLFASVKEMDLFTLFEKSAGICVSASDQKISAASVLASVLRSDSLFIFPQAESVKSINVINAKDFSRFI